MKVCVVGSGGREHVFATTLARTAEVVVTPGSPGIEGSVSQEALEVEADLYVIGPEAQLVHGLADELRNNKKLVFGPGADGAKLEGDGGGGGGGGRSGVALVFSGTTSC